MKIQDMNDIQIQEMVLGWNIEYEESYLYAIEHGKVEYPNGITELEMLQDHENAVHRVQEATIAYHKFRSENAEWFI